MQKLLLSCKSFEDSRFLKNYIETELPFEVVLAAQPVEIETSLKAKSLHLLLMQTGNLVTHDLEYALHLRKTGYNYPIMMITNSVGDIDIEEAHEKHKVYFLERPFELRVLKGLVRKLMVTKAVPQQIFRRYRTNVAATLETFISGDRFETQMFNLSKGGAYFELTRKPALSVGDLLRLKVSLGREHSIHGRVMWTTHKGPVAGGYGIGIKFMRSSEIYRGLMDKP